ncbi:MAG: ABC transporter permease [Caldilinea sp.]|nr:ABC transporter permease [Caldilinea sp.]MCB9117830.1 ABC transporter permease [Caldilineaceae bacterium]MCB9121759.1 ABC transporter permease [Caldilineaceae bacterium]MCO5212620.1 ABC transporter permease [Caldilinea sp.]MCW5844012.1 ABC transporter permease [Caldilinea sp.]
MTTYLVRRLLQTIVVIFGVTILSFFALHLAGDPTYLYVSERATDEEVAETRAKLGFDKPLHEQYFSYVVGLATLDLGNSLRSRTPAFELVMERMPATLELTIFAILFATLLAIPIGILSATRRGTPLDGGIMLFAMFGQSMPSFWLGIMLILVVGLWLRWLPISGQVPIIQPLLDGDFQTAITNFPDAIRHLILPGITLGVFSLARNARLVRSSMLEVLNQDYVTTAKAKGLARHTVIMRHAFRNSLIPFVTIIGLEFGFLLSGVVVTETVFSWPGVGRLVFNAINQRDIPVVQAAVVMFSLLFVLLNLIVDVVYTRLDPRIRLS